MKAFYEVYRDFDDDITVNSREDFSFPLHFHASVEIFILLKGRYRVTADNRTYEMEENSVFISDTFCMHSYTKLTESPSESVLMIIPSPYLVDYNAAKNGRALKSCITTNARLVNEIHLLSSFIKEHGANEKIKKNYTNALLLLLLEELDVTNSTQKQDVTIIKNVLLYIEDNFRENITLNSIARHFGYTTCHLSRVFHSYFTVSISRYINNMRIKYIESKKDSCNNLLSLIYDSGFQSPQTYYRNLKYYKQQIVK
ncbi:MAG: helix-turn-helix transcriptional regulator [Clostridia bacterium]|nr:helix-turn-helix transcriptional regulator [Clostridia bacterium]